MFPRVRNAGLVLALCSLAGTSPAMAHDTGRWHDNGSSGKPEWQVREEQRQREQAQGEREQEEQRQRNEQQQRRVAEEQRRRTEQQRRRDQAWQRKQESIQHPRAAHKTIKPAITTATRIGTVAGATTARSTWCATGTTTT